MPPACEACGDTGWIDVRLVSLVVLEGSQGPWDRKQPIHVLAAFCSCQADRRLALLRRSCGAPEWARLDTFKKGRGTEEALAAVREVLKLSGAMPYNTLLVSGSFGCGKSHLAGGLAYALADRGTSARYRYVPDLLAEIRQAIGSEEVGAADNLVDGYMRQYVLVLDDLGAGRPGTDFTRDVIERIVNGRYERGPLLVVTTNLTGPEMEERWGRRVADRLLDSRSGRARQVEIKAKSFRTGR